MKTLVMETDARIYIKGGRRGYLLGMPSAELVRVLSPTLVDVGIEE